MSTSRNVRTAEPPRPPRTARAGRSVIAVIGIDQYQHAAWPRLDNAVSDATAAARLFTQLGFAVAAPPLLDGAATGEAMRRLVTTDLEGLGPDDSLVVFFAGHGHTDTAAFDDVAVKTGYLIPVDGADPAGGEGATWLRLDSWLSDLARLQPRHILVLLDSCHSGIALSSLHKWRDGGGQPGELDALSSRRSRRVITSALDDQRAMDGGPVPGHSLFTACLIEGLSGGLLAAARGVATGRELGQYLQDRVRSYPHTTQTPDFGAFELDDRGDIAIPVLGPRRKPSTDGGFAWEPVPLPRPRRRWWPVAAGAAGAGLLIALAARCELPGSHGEPRAASLTVPPIDVKGSVLEPRALGTPWVPWADPSTLARGASEVARLRESIRRTKDPIQRRARSVALAGSLYAAASPISKPLGGLTADGNALIVEARQLLREVVRDEGDASAEATLRLLGACDLLLGDFATAETTWRTLVERHPDSKDEPSHRAWYVYALLRQSKSAVALSAVTAERVDVTHPELAYTAAWARWRSHDGSGAWAALATAHRRWAEAEYPCRDDRHACIFQGAYTKDDQLEREARALAGLADVPLDRAAEVLAPAGDGDRDRRRSRYSQLEALGLRYGANGRWANAVAALDRAIEVAGDGTPADGRIVVRRSQAEFTVRLDAPASAARYAALAIDAFARCATGDAGAQVDREQSEVCLRVRRDTVPRVYEIAQLFRSLYLATGDARYYQPARDLYAMTLPLIDNGATHMRARDEAASLDGAPGTARPAATGDPGAIAALITRHTPEVEACYDLALGDHPALTGEIALGLDADPGGAIERAVAVPGAGPGGLAAVARCIADRARRWRLPVRPAAGDLHIALRYSLSGAKPQS